MSLRVSYVCSYYAPAWVYGGPVKSVSRLCEALTDCGADVRVLTTNANGRTRLNVPIGTPVDVNGVPVTYYRLSGLPPKGAFHSPGLVRACVHAVANSDVVVLDTWWAHSFRSAVRACRVHRVPYVIVLHGQLLPWAMRMHSRRKRLYLALGGGAALRDAAAVICTSGEEVKGLERMQLRARTALVANGVDLQSSQIETGVMRRRLGVPDGTPIAVFLGRLHQKKRPDLAIEGIAAARAQGCDVRLVVAGPEDGWSERQLRGLASVRRCEGAVHFVGLLDHANVQRLLADADVLLMPSEPESENFGMSAAEALAAGVPVIASGGVPVASNAEAAGAARIVALTADDIARALVDLLEPSTNQKIRAAARAFALDTLDIRKRASQFHDVLQDAVDRNVGRKAPAAS
jgi:glycosyltransferase involved in cell wall biosynthesis